ncbi:unnamed protein product [Rhizophagus irregularis]|nr:unnamed protein product [Rhizophagus irregularis]
MPSTLRSYKGPSVQPFHFSAPQVILSSADMPLPPLQTSDWAFLGIHWLHSSLTRQTTWSHHLSGFLKSRTVLIWNHILALLSSLRTYKTMSTPKAPSVINSNIPPPPRPDTSAPSGD